MTRIVNLQSAVTVRVRRSINPACSLDDHRWREFSMTTERGFIAFDDWDTENVQRTILVLCEACGRTPLEAVDTAITRSLSR